ncbi:MmgE/PrpD family protein [Natronomonas marina]|jgi:2-methylcitrate dehydratase|uniref:MmgE/PrpD family protein n=1 Tax=Natronomonas marina TaxID=2961939 RepID=UPI0020C968B6|nr:MmgE/PrpD family protein [Natronomonas marina]
MTSTAELARFAAEVSYEGLPESVREATKRRVLDAVGVGLGSVGREPTGGIRRAVSVQNATGRSRLWGSDLGGSPPDAALYDAALVARGNGAVFLSPTLSAAGGTVAAVLAAAEARSATGEAVLAGLAAGHEVHGELAWNAPIEGFHPATHGAVAAAAGAARAAGLDAGEIENAVGIAAARATLAVGDDDFDTLAVGLAARAGVDGCLLAESGVEAPDAIGGTGGWHDLVGPFDLDFDPGCERVGDAAVRLFDAHPYAQASLEAAVELVEDAAIDPAEVDAVTVETFADAVPEVTPSAVAAALVDRDVTVRPTERADLRPVADAVEVRADADLTGRADRGETPARVTVECRDGAVHEVETDRFTGHPARPAPWGTVEEKFHALAAPRYDAERRTEIVETVRGLEAETVAELSRLLD